MEGERKRVSSKKQKKEKEEKKFSWPIYKRFFRYTLNRWKSALLCLIFIIVNGFTVSIFPWKVGVVLDLITAASNTKSEEKVSELHSSIN